MATRTEMLHNETRNGHTGNGQGTDVATTSRVRGLETSGRPYGGAVRTGQPSGWTPSFAQTPFGLMQRMVSDMDRLFDSFGFGRTLSSPIFGTTLNRSSLQEPVQQNQYTWSPAVETFVRDGHVVIRALLPGVNKDDVAIDVVDNVLTLEGERRPAVDQPEGWYRSELTYGRFYREFLLPEGIDTAAISATFENGVLEISLPAPKRESRKIEIR